jgi:hypothetical protein
VNGTLFFTGNDGKTGIELWKLTLAAPAVAGTIRVNAGGIAFATADARNFVADTYFSGGTVSAASTAGIAGTADDYLYQTGRHGSSFAYNFPTGNGSYDVVLHFAETYFGVAAPGGAGSRKFHVNIEGARKLTDYDVFARAGGALRVAQGNVPGNGGRRHAERELSEGSRRQPGRESHRSTARGGGPDGQRRGQRLYHGCRQAVLARRVLRGRHGVEHCGWRNCQYHR